MKKDNVEIERMTCSRSNSSDTNVLTSVVFKRYQTSTSETRIPGLTSVKNTTSESDRATVWTEKSK